MSPDAPTFTLTRLELDGAGRLVLSGHWSGVRGMRFVRPALLIELEEGERTVLATLEHKPWTPSEGAEWVAAFPWNGGPVDPADARLAVGPSIEVPVAPGAEGSRPLRTTLRERLAEAEERGRRLEAEVAFLRAEREQLLARLAAAGERS